jgi:ATP-dependent DNA helicase RecG
LKKTLDGFALAEYDLETRGPGEVYGTAQSGMMRLRLASMRDVGLITLARELARGLDFTTHTKLREKVRIWEQKIHLE